MLYYYCSKQQSILYHYMESIIWENEYLKYEDVSDNAVSRRLPKDMGILLLHATIVQRARKQRNCKRLMRMPQKQYRGVMDEEDR